MYPLIQSYMNKFTSHKKYDNISQNKKKSNIFFMYAGIYIYVLTIHAKYETC